MHNHNDIFILKHAQNFLYIIEEKKSFFTMPWRSIFYTYVLTYDENSRRKNSILVAITSLRSRRDRDHKLLRQRLNNTLCVKYLIFFLEGKKGRRARKRKLSFVDPVSVSDEFRVFSCWVHYLPEIINFYPGRDHFAYCYFRHVYQSEREREREY